jgi:hypothetical protein
MDFYHFAITLVRKKSMDDEAQAGKRCRLSALRQHFGRKGISTLRKSCRQNESPANQFFDASHNIR